MEDDTLVAAIATQPSDVAKQICLYAMMRQYRLVWDFMLTVIGEKYQKLDSSFGRVDLNTFSCACKAGRLGGYMERFHHYESQTGADENARGE